eukprot:Phypoly_transcript_00599.p1 GENE.Phypoly_transcript_00599~~Phypoly_transcript_00599.p1  ORF type:complete len:744 (+),score=73.21 Phypoly_transcript_00599:1984-4215(+)
MHAFLPYNCHTIQQEDVDEYQKACLGRFFLKGAIAPGKSATHITLTMLRLPPDAPEPTAANGVTVSTIIEQDKSVLNDKCMIVMIGTPGCGKTATIIRTARKHFLVYICCSTLGERLPELRDMNFLEMVNYIAGKDKISRKIQWEDGDTLVSCDSEMKLMAMARVRVEILGRLMFLLLLLWENSSLTPETYFREQVNGGSQVIQIIVRELLNYESDSVRDMLAVVFNEVKVRIGGARALVFAVDEAQLAQESLFGLVSPSALANHKSNYDNLLDGKQKLQLRYKRGLLTPLCGAIGELDATIIVSGTMFSLADADQVGTAFLKKRTLVQITTFPTNSAENIDAVIGTVVDMTGCVTPLEKCTLIAGRQRNGMNTVRQLLRMGDQGGSKQDVWNNVLDTAIQIAKKELVEYMDNLLAEDPGGIAQLLNHMVIGGSLGGRVAFSMRTDADFVNKGICTLERDADGYHWQIKEPLVVEAARESLGKEQLDPVFATCLQSLDSLLSMLGPSTTTKGNILEPMVRHALSNFNGTLICDLPFLGLANRADLPLWTKQQRLTITKTGTAQQLGFANDADFLKKRTPGLQLCPESTTRPDSILFLSPSYGASLAIKFYTSKISGNVQTANESSSDLHKCFLQVDGTVNPSVRKYRSDFEQSLKIVPIHGVLRILVEFPKGSECKSRVQGQDIIVYVTCDNMDKFFNETGQTEQQKQGLRDLKALIRYIAIKQGCLLTTLWAFIVLWSQAFV